MKNSAHCPRCQGRVFFRIDEVQTPNPQYSNTLVPLALTGFYGKTEEKGLLGGAKMRRSVVNLEAWVCKECSYVELYAKDLDVLEQAADRAPRVHVIDRTKEGAGPFR